MADGLHGSCPGLSFKPQQDGAAHWVIELNLQTPLLCTITQLDDGVDTAIAAMILALFLKGFEDKIREEITTAQGMATNELYINICNIRDVPKDIEGFMKPALESQVCAVTRPSNPLDSTAPTVVVCREDIANNWAPGHRGGGSMQILIGLTLVEIVYRLFAGEVDLDSLNPKIVELVRETTS